MFTFDSEEEELANKNLILAGEICGNCGHNHSNRPDEVCGTVCGPVDASAPCECDIFTPFVSALFDASGNLV